MRALIEGERIAQISTADFEVAEPLYWVDVPDGTTTLDTYASGAVVKYVPPLPTLPELEAERDRRLGLGFNYPFPDSRGVQRIGTTPKDLAGWDEVITISNAAINTGSPGLTINIVTNTGPCTVTALEWQQVLLAAGQFRQPIWQAYFSLEASGAPFPADYAADYHWPAVA